MTVASSVCMTVEGKKNRKVLRLFPLFQYANVEEWMFHNWQILFFLYNIHAEMYILFNIRENIDLV